MINLTIDLTYRTRPSATYKWGYVSVFGDGSIHCRYWFKTQKAARSWGRQFPDSFAIARFVQ